MTVGVVIGAPAARVALLPHGVCTTHPPGPWLSTGKENPWGDMTALAGGSAAAVGGGGGGVVGGGAVVVGASVVVGSVPAARSSGTRGVVEPHAAHTRSATTVGARRGTVPVWSIRARRRPRA